MSTEVKVNLPSIDRLKSFIENGLEKSIIEASIKVRGEILNRWKSQKGADNTSFKPISKEYAKIKKERPVIDMLKTGDMTQDFGVKEHSKTYAYLGFSSEQLPKARGNYGLRPNMLKVDKSLVKIAQDKINADIKKVI